MRSEKANRQTVTLSRSTFTVLLLRCSCDDRASVEVEEGRGLGRFSFFFVWVKLSNWASDLSIVVFMKKQICNNHLTNHKKHSHLVLEFGSLLTEEDENKGGFDPPLTIEEDLFRWWWKLFTFYFYLSFSNFTFYFWLLLFTFTFYFWLLLFTRTHFQPSKKINLGENFDYFKVFRAKGSVRKRPFPGTICIECEWPSSYSLKI